MLMFDTWLTHNSAPRTWSKAALPATAILATGASTLFGYAPPPSTSILNSALAIVGWGLFVVALGASNKSSLLHASRGLVSLLGALSILAMASIAAPFWAGQLVSLAISGAGMLAMAATLVIAGAVASGSGRLQSTSSAIAWAWLVAGLLSFIVSVIQVFAPELADGFWVARTGFIGRAVGNLRQPNHLSTLFLWSSVSTVWLKESGALRGGWAAVVHLLTVAGVAMTGSHTGIVGLSLLMGWGILDKSLARGTRRMLMLSLVIFLAVSLGLAVWAHVGHHVFGAAERLINQHDISSSRFSLWSNTLRMIAQHPWTGVGYGGFNFAWTLTAFPQRPVAFYDHTHNIELQFLVELGLPVALAVLALFAYALRCAFVVSSKVLGPDGIALRSVLVMLLLMLLHSQLEYPLWYAHFLLPTAMLFGLILGYQLRGDDDRLLSKNVPGTKSLPVSHALMLAGSLTAVVGLALMIDYARITPIFSQSALDTSLADRILRGQRSSFFSYQADYAAVTSIDHPSEAMNTFKSAVHNVLDPHLMIAWAVAFAERGDLERARNIAARLREFHSRQADDFFKQCYVANVSNAGIVSRPFQCDPPNAVLGPEDFR